MSGEFAVPLWVPACALFVCGDVESDQSELLCVGYFQGQNAGTADGPLDRILGRRQPSVPGLSAGVVCASKGYMNRPGWHLPSLYAQSFKLLLNKKNKPLEIFH